jgi:hypothetical protein
MSQLRFCLIATCYLFALSGCDSDEADIKASFESADYGIYFLSPEQGQGFSSGEEIQFIAQATLFDSHGNPLNPNLLNHLDIKLYSDLDGLLDGDLTNEGGNITFRTNQLSASEHQITIKAVDPNLKERSTSVSINTLAPGTIKLTVEKDNRENAIVSWTIPHPELVHRFELYRTHYTFVDGGTSYHPQPWDTIRFTAEDKESYYDSKLPYADKVTYSMKVFTAESYWSKNKMDTTIDGAKRFDLFPLSDGHDWNAYSVDALSVGLESIIHIRSGSHVVAFNYENMTISKELNLSYPINYFHVGSYGRGTELFIADENTLRIYDSDSYNFKELIELDYKIEGIQGYNSALYLSTENHVDRISLAGTNNVARGLRFRLLEDGTSLLGITYSRTPADMKYVDFKDDINNPRIVDDQYHGTYPLNPGLFEVIPKQNLAITSWFGSIYTADEDMQYVGSLSDIASESFTCFAFNESGTIIYAGVVSQKKLSVYSSSEMKKLGEIETKGYPAFIFFKDTKLVVVSAVGDFDRLRGPSEIGFEIFGL